MKNHLNKFLVIIVVVATIAVILSYGKPAVGSPDYLVSKFPAPTDICYQNGEAVVYSAEVNSNVDVILFSYLNTSGQVTMLKYGRTIADPGNWRLLYDVKMEGVGCRSSRYGR